MGSTEEFTSECLLEVPAFPCSRSALAAMWTWVKREDTGQEHGERPPLRQDPGSGGYEPLESAENGTGEGTET